MAKNEWEERNTVSGDGQVSKNIYFEGNPAGSPRVMFVGNSITRHAALESIGWFYDWGMAASKKENDYVHKVMSGILKKQPDAAFCVVQAAVWECNYTSKDYDMWFATAKNFRPDIIICSISANIQDSLFEHDKYVENIDSLLTYLAGGNEDVKIFHSSSFFDNTAKNAAIRSYTEKSGATLVYISDVKNDESNLAIGQWEHEGIQVHPGDKGMAELATRYLKAIDHLI